MFDKAIELYSKFAIYLIYILIFSIFLASFHPQIFIHFFNAVTKFIPIPIINYYSEKNINHTDLFHIFTIVSAISGIGAIWNLFYPRIYIGKMLKIGLYTKEYPSFHMASIHSNSSTLTTLFLLSSTLLIQTKVTSFLTIKSLALNLLQSAPTIFIFCCIGTLEATFYCFALILSGFGTAEEKN